MACMERTSAATTMDLPAVQGSSTYVMSGFSQIGSLELYSHIPSEELNNLLHQDFEDYRNFEPEPEPEPLDISELNPPTVKDPFGLSESDDDFISFYMNGQGIALEKTRTEAKSDLGELRHTSDLTCLLSDVPHVMVNPTAVNPFIHRNSYATPFSEEPVELQNLRKPYHPYQDHDYLPRNDEGENNMVNVDIFSEDDVEVWEIENFIPTSVSSTAVPEQLPIGRSTFKEGTRSSARTAEIRQREQARKISNAVHAAVLTDKVRNTRKFKNIKPKNSVETTPSQSDIEEFYSQPVRRTYTRTTKKKTCKGRTDHSESERHRREVLRRNFSSLCDLIPNEYLRGDKASSQISKQKILNGAKSYLMAIHSAKSSCKTLYIENKLYREQWQKLQVILQKRIKR